MFKPQHTTTNSGIMDAEEIVLVAREAQVTSALWHLRMGDLNSQDMVKLRSRALGMCFDGEPCFCQTCVLAKMKEGKDKLTWHQNKTSVLMCRVHTRYLPMGFNTP